MIRRKGGWLLAGCCAGAIGCGDSARRGEDAATSDLDAPSDVDISDASDESDVIPIVADSTVPTEIAVPQDMTDQDDTASPADIAVPQDTTDQDDAASPPDIAVPQDMLAPLDLEPPQDGSEYVDDTSDVLSTTPALHGTFETDDATLAPDPERGFFRWAGDITTVSSASLQSLYASGMRLAYAMIRLDDVRTGPIGETRLATIATGFARFRDAGLKAIVRVVYNYPSGETEYRNAEDASLAQVLSHIAELAPVLADNADVIAFIQAGFIGAWGEWHTSSNGLTTAANRTAIRDALLMHFPANRTISFRYPPHIRTWYPILPTVDDVLDGAFPRIGFHNDCFLASESDVGTYPTAERELIRAFMKDFGQLLPFGGETCNPADESNPTARMSCADILGEGPAYGLTYLNRDYWQVFHDGWRSEGCLDEVQRSMGHRLSLVELELPARIARSADFEVRLRLRNDGWARPHNPRPVVLRFGEGVEARSITLGCADVRTLGRGTSATFTCSVRMFDDMGRGTYPVAVQLPDAAPGLAQDVRYHARLFNGDVPDRGQRWNASTGTFETGLSVAVD
jgi:hypothetical protein